MAKACYIQHPVKQKVKPKDRYPIDFGFRVIVLQKNIYFTKLYCVQYNFITFAM